MLNIIYITFLTIVFTYVSPIIDHLMPDYDEKQSFLEILIEIIIQLLIIGAIVYLFIKTNDYNLIKKFIKISNNEEIIIDLIFTIVFIGTQKQLSLKLEHLTNYHHVKYLFTPLNI